MRCISTKQAPPTNGFTKSTAGNSAEKVKNGCTGNLTFEYTKQLSLPTSGTFFNLARSRDTLRKLQNTSRILQNQS